MNLLGAPELGKLFDARMNALTLRQEYTVPAILANGGENAATKFLEFFAAMIRLKAGSTQLHPIGSLWIGGKG